MPKLTVPRNVEASWPKLHDAIHQAYKSGDVSALRSLLQTELLEVTADHHSWSTGTVLHTAACTNLKIVDLLLDSGADRLIHARCGPGEEGRWAGHTALQVAAKRGAHAIVARLAKSGSDYDVFSASALGDSRQLAQLLVDNKSLLESKDAYNSTPLHWAAEQNRYETTKLLLNNSVDVDVANDFGETPLLISSTKGIDSYKSSGRSAVKLLMDQGAARDAATFAAFGDVGSLEPFLDSHPDSVSAPNCHGTTPLHWAARNAQVATAKLLLHRRAYINALDAIGCTPLWYATSWANDVEMTRFLCKNGADTNVKNVWNKSLSDYDIGWECNTVVLRYRPSC